MNDIKLTAQKMTQELIEKAKLKQGDILVVGCSSSEIVGETIGKNSSMDAAKAVFEGIYSIVKEKGIFLAAQCCEHLNRAIIIEKEALKDSMTQVSVRPVSNAGGSFATTAWESFSNPVAVEEIKADAGMDIGNTLIGMHLKRVAVPVRLSADKIGKANLVCARTRAKYIGGPRAQYETSER